MHVPNQHKLLNFTYQIRQSNVTCDLRQFVGPELNCTRSQTLKTVGFICPYNNIHLGDKRHLVSCRSCKSTLPVQPCGSQVWGRNPTPQIQNIRIITFKTETQAWIECEKNQRPMCQPRSSGRFHVLVFFCRQVTRGRTSTNSKILWDIQYCLSKIAFNQDIHYHSPFLSKPRPHLPQIRNACSTAS